MVEYASTVWDPNTRRNINKLESKFNVTQPAVSLATTTTLAASLQCSTILNVTIGAASSSQSPSHAVQNLQPSGRHRFHIPAYTETAQYQRSCISFPTTTVQLCCLLQLVPSSYCPGLECTGGGSTTFQTADAFKNYLFTDPSSHHLRF